MTKKEFCKLIADVPDGAHVFLRESSGRELEMVFQIDARLIHFKGLPQEGIDTSPFTHETINRRSI